MKKYLNILGILVLVWIIVQCANIFILYQEQNIVVLSQLKEWRPWAITFIVMILYTFVKDQIKRGK